MNRDRALICLATAPFQNPVAALRQSIALVHLLAQAAGLLNILKSFIEASYRRQGARWVTNRRLALQPNRIATFV